MPSPQPGPSGNLGERPDAHRRGGTPGLKPELAEDVEVVAVNDLEEGKTEDSSIGMSDLEEPFSASSSEVDSFSLLLLIWSGLALNCPR